jgi:hypothetical protein
MPAALDTAGVMRLVGRYGIAHACAVDGVILTAAHVVQPFTLADSPIAESILSYTWSDDLGNEGVVVGAMAMASRDLGMLELRTGTPRNYTHSLAELTVGQEVFWEEYDLAKVQSAYQPVIRRAKVVTLLSGHVLLDPAPAKGASGGCLFDATSQVNGVVIWNERFPNGGVGWAASVAGQWWPIP